MTWNYQIIRTSKRFGKKIVHFYNIHEVYRSGKKISWTLEPVSADGTESIRDIKLALSMMLTDIERHPVAEIIKGKFIERKK